MEFENRSMSSAEEEEKTLKNLEVLKRIIPLIEKFLKENDVSIEDMMLMIKVMSSLRYKF